MIRQKCVSSEIIYDYAQGLLDETTTKLTRQHIEECPRCQVRLREASQLVKFIEDDARLTVPSRAHQRSVSFFRPWYESRLREAPAQPESALKKFLSRLITDTRGLPGLSGPAVAGLRSTAFLNRDYQLLFSLDEGRVEVDLKVSQTSSEGFYDVLGQVVGLEGQTCRVELVTPKNATLPASLDETFTFQFQDLPAGSYSLNISCDEESFEITPILL